MDLIVQHNGVLAFRADNLVQTGNTFNFTDNGPPPVDPARLTTALVTWLTHDQFTASTDVTKYKNLAGTILRGQPPLEWPYANGSTWKLQCPANKYLAMEVVPGTAPGTKSVSVPTYSHGVPVIVSLSYLPGDFNPATALKVAQYSRPDATILTMRNSLPDTDYYKYVIPGVRYFLNIKPVDNTRIQTIGIAS